MVLYDRSLAQLITSWGPGTFVEQCSQVVWDRDDTRTAIAPRGVQFGLVHAHVERGMRSILSRQVHACQGEAAEGELCSAQSW